MTIASLLADLDLPGARLVGNADLPIRQPVNPTWSRSPDRGPCPAKQKT